ncbi:MAG: guanylate kinase [Eubacteriales bacterium]|nr:guanylate kinase [Eubacteriales bacterium]
MAKGLLIVYTGASGVGKGTVMKRLLQENSNLRLSVSATTRAPRPGETNGIEYHFVTIDKFKEMIANDELLEHAVYCGNYYGTPEKSVRDMIDSGLDVMLEIEVEGYKQIKKQFPDCVTIFMLPPSVEELEKRLSGRGTEKQDVVQQRLNRAVEEMTFAKYFDYQVTNDDVEKTKDEILNIIANIKKERN